MTEHQYSAADITVLEFDESVRKRPGMYFGVARDDPRLATRVFREVVSHAYHPAARVAAVHVPHVVAEVTGDLAFSVTDDQADTDLPRLGYHDSLLTPERWLSAAAAAVSARTTVEVWRDGRGFRQELEGLRPTGPPVAFEAPAGAGTRVACVLDAAYLGPAAIAADLGGLDLHGPDCHGPEGPGSVVIRDLRDGVRSTHVWSGDAGDAA